MEKNYNRITTVREQQEYGNTSMDRPKPELKERSQELNRVAFFRDMQELLPGDFKMILDSKIIGQEEAKKALSVALYKHCQNLFADKVEKSNVLIFGPSGSGKTEMARCLASELHLPFIIYDATSLTEAGYAGDDAADMIKQLYYRSGGDRELTEHGIIYIDEIDKLAGGSGDIAARYDVGKEGAQQSLLRILEDDHVVLNTYSKESSISLFSSMEKKDVEISTKNILFIGAGALVKEAKRECRMGFLSEEEVSEGNDALTYKDLVGYGFIPEFIRRFSKITQTRALTKDQLAAVLSKKDGILEQYRRLFYENGKRLSWDENFIMAIAEKAMNEPTGVSALKSCLDRITDDLLFHCLDRDNRTHSIMLTDADVR